MPKRRVTAARKAQLQRWQRAGAQAARRAAARANAKGSYSHPINKRARLKHQVKTGQLGYTPPGFGGRRSKQGGKQYQHKTGTGFKPSAEAQAILAGKQGFRNPAVSAMEARAALGIGPKVPKPEWYAKKLKPSEVHGSGTGLTSAYRYGPANPANRRKRGKK